MYKNRIILHQNLFHFSSLMRSFSLDLIFFPENDEKVIFCHIKFRSIILSMESDDYEITEVALTAKY
jgi:hypothetical protein